MTPAEWDRLQSFIDRLENAWEEATGDEEPGSLDRFLPPEDDSLRGLILQELILTDLEFRWRRGLRAGLEEYLQQYPELGDAETLPPELIYEEYRIRKRYEDPLSLADYERHYPRQFAELQRLVHEKPVPVARVPHSPPAPLLLPAGTGSLERQVDRFIQPASDGSKMLFPGSGYRLLKRIGGGSFGEVWHGEGPGGIKLAIKIVYGSITDKEAGQRELEALEAMKRLRHMFLVPIHDYWQLEDRVILAMELAEGSLRDLQKKSMKTSKPGISLEELLRYFGEAAEAIDHLHSRHMLHRDIKPENLLHLGGHVRVADFGLAHLVEHSRGLAMLRRWWRPDCLAPEIISHGEAREQSDQYSLAASYVELRLNRMLFPRTSYFQTLESHLKRVPDLSPLDPAEQEVLQRALAKDPHRRYRTCREFMDELEKAVTGKCRQASPYPARRPLFALILLLFASLGVMGLLTWYLAFRSAMVP